MIKNNMPKHEQKKWVLRSIPNFLKKKYSSLIPNPFIGALTEIKIFERQKIKKMNNRVLEIIYKQLDKKIVILVYNIF